MTISNAQNSIQVQGNGIQTSFEFPFIGVSTSNIIVTYINSVGSYTVLPPTSYTITLNPAVPNQIWGVGGVVNYPLSGSPIAVGTSLLIQRVLPYTQNVSIQNQGNVYPQVTEQALDKLCMEIQQLVSRTGAYRGIWATSVFYNFGDVVVDGINGSNTNNIYMCAVANTSGTWTTDLQNGDWVISIDVQSIIQALPTINNNQVFGNISGLPTTPIGIGLSAFIDSAISNVQGSILYRNSGGWVGLGPGTPGQFLETLGAGADLQWSSSGSGTVSTTGSPATGQLTRFSGSNTITNDNLSGDLTTSGALVTTLATVNGNVGSFGSASAVPVVTVNAKGLITAVSTASVSIPLITPLGVGSFVMGSAASGAAGTTISGASITAVGGIIPRTSTDAWGVTGDSLSGTWKRQQTNDASSGAANIVLFQRIA